MCGVAGFFSFNVHGPLVCQEEMKRISEHMYSRGPDDKGLWFSKDRRVGLVHRRLAIIDLSTAARQPMLDSETGNHIVFNGEIYNFSALRSELVKFGYRFKTHSDTEVLLKLYSAYGPEMVHKLRGMYAFGIWDENKKGLFLARDPFGIKPLYYAQDGKCFRFASQVKALLAGGRIDKAPNPAGQVGFYLWGHVPEPFTFYKNIAALPAGCSLWVDNQGSRNPKVFFNVSQELSFSTLDSANSTLISPGEAKEKLYSSLRDSINCHLVGDVEVGLFLSAGLDSATMTAITAEGQIKKSKADQLRTITLGFREFANTVNDEVPIAKIIAEHYDTAHTTSWVCKDLFNKNLEHLLHSMDQPSIDGVNSYFVSLAAKEAGIKVALSGLGGDELFAGYSSFNDIPSMVRLLRPFSKIPFLGRAFCLATAPILRHRTSPKYAGLLDYGGDYEGAYLLRRGLFMPWELPEVLDGELVKEGWSELNAMSTMSNIISGISHKRLKVSALEISCYMRNRLLRDTDWASMAHSLEVRVPMVDVELLKTVANLVNSGQAPSKMDMAMAPAKQLPSRVLNRKKTGFSVPVQEWLLESIDAESQKMRGGLRPWASFLHHNSLKYN